MSNFSQKCKQLLTENGASVYHFSNIYHMDRTTLQRMVTGKRLPGKEFVTEFCSHLRMTPFEEESLLELYEIERIGTSRYKNRLLIKETIEYIGNLQQQEHIFPSPLVLKDTMTSPYADPVFTKGNVDTFHYLSEVITRESFRSPDTGNPVFYTNIPTSCTAFLTELKRVFFNSSMTARIEHLLTLHKNPEQLADSSYNLNMLKEVLPFAIQPHLGYSAYYLYSGSELPDVASCLWPYYLITTTQVILLSADYNRAVIYTNPELVRHYTEEFQLTLKKSMPLIYQAENVCDAVSFFINSLNGKKDTVLYTYDSCLCLLRLFDFSLIKSHFKSDLILQIIKEGILKDLIVQYHQENNIHAFLPLSALKHFYETGELSAKYSEFLHPFSIPERKKVLEKLYQLCVNGEYFLYLLPDTYFSCQPQINFEIHNDSTISMLPLNSGTIFSFFQISESSIYDAFFDYFTGLGERSDVIKPEQTIKIIKKYLD
ncbi:MAG: hypothetical protein Q4B70_01105 [Lachnospiraceae bacterium]|nr:hypothetical protein [Lachnospiraceae bacterium]